MLTLLYAFLALMGLGLLATARAALRAPDGFEDSDGFHLRDEHPPQTDEALPDSLTAR